MPSAASDSSNEDVEMEDSDGCRLPQELMHRILVEACGPPTISRVTVVGRSDTDTDTLLQLSLASKQLYAFATPRLYAWVRLTRPSALKAFQQTLSSRPALGRLVVGLHIGADTSLEKAWWPMATRQGFGGPTFDLNVDEDNDGYPLALTRTGVIFAIDGSSHRPLAAALEAAARCLDVDLCQLGLDRSAREIGSDAWHIRVLEAQAAVELYHLHTKGHEVNNTTYPRLVVSERAPARGGNIFRVTRRDIYMRLTRVGAPTDSFQHPLIFARSGLLWEAKALDNVEHRSSVPACYNEEEDPADVFTWPLTGAAESADEGEEMGEDVKAVPYPADLSDPHDFAIPATATVAGNLALARSLLGLTTCVQSLSLTGRFECSIVGERFGPALPDLRSLTIGPSPNFWGLTLNYGNVTLRPVKRLQICGGFWSGEEIERMSQSGQLVNLREIHWTSLEQYSDGDVDQ